MGEFPTFKGLWPWHWPWFGSHWHRHASLIDLYRHTKFHWNGRNFLWTYGRTFETHFIRL